MTPADDKARSPADQADRDRIVASRGANLLVEAGAGTGKTHLMVERVLHLVANEPDFRLRDIAAITFTERAAAELRSRIRERLLDEVRDTGDVRYRKALADLPLAAAGTIHAFAARIVREHPVEAGIAPGFAIDEGDDLAREVFSRWRAASVRDDPELWDTLLAFAPVDARQDAMFDLARAMLDHPDAFASIRAPESIDTVGEIGAVLQLANGILSLGDELGVDADDALYRATADACDVLRDLAALDADLLDDAVRRAKLPGRRGLGGKKGWGDRAEQAKGAGNALRDMFAIMQTRIGERIVLLAANAIVKFRDELWHARQTEGALSFTDLLSIARKILSEHKHVRAAEQARWRYILVDEFQDTDPTQVEFLRLLAGDKPGRVFYVGDPKQSIYRFRRADIEMYDDVRRTVGELAAIRVNFRCRPCVIDFVNGVFPEMMGRLAPPAQARYAPLEAHRDAALAGPGVAVLVGSAAAPGNEEADGANGAADNGEDNDPGLDAARRREAIAIADLIARIVAEKWQVEDRRERREATWRDIAVLYPKRTGIEYLDEEIARRGIPYASDMTRIFYTTREVRYLVQVLAAIARPHDRIALAAALASPFFAFSDADLAAWARSNGGLPWSGSIFDPQSSILDSIPGLADALTFLAELHRERDRAPIHRTIDRVLNETAALPFLHGDPRGAAIAAQLQTLRDRARLRQAEHRLTFGETVSWLVGELREAAEVNEKVEPDLLDDRVRLMTFHKAKGLEFPITIVANLSTRQASRGISPVLAVREGESVRHEFALGGFDGAKLETAGYGAASEHEKEMLRAEQVRQLYVACTRARDHLVVSWFPPIGPGRNESRYLDHFPAPLPELAASENPPGGLGLIVAAPPGAAPGIAASAEPPLPADLSAARVESAREIRALLATAQAWTPSRLAHPRDDQSRDREGAGGAVLDTDERDDDAPAWSAQREASLSFGKLFHRAMESCVLADASTFAPAVRAIDGALADVRVAEVVDAMKRALATPIGKRLAACAPDALGRELPYTIAREDGALVDGAIDAVLREGGAYVIVDYKTDRVAALKAAQRAEFHRPQLAAYADALERITGARPAEAHVIFARTGEAVRLW